MIHEFITKLKMRIKNKGVFDRFFFLNKIDDETSFSCIIIII